MKVLFVLTYYRPHWTGLTQYAARLAEGLAKLGHDVQVLCSQHQKDLPLEEEIKQVKVLRLPYLFKFLRSVIIPGFPFQLWQKIKTSDKVIVYLPMQEVLLVAILCKIQRKKLFLVHNGDLILPREGGWWYRLIEKIYFLTTGWAISLSEKIIIQTKDYAQSSLLLKRFETKWAEILPLYDAAEVPAEKVDDFLLANKLVGKTLIGYSGRFVEEKGIDFLLQAIPLIKKKIKTAHFVFAGDYKIQYEQFWQKIAPLIEDNKEHITLLGLISDTEKLVAFYRVLSVYVQPSRTDCFPSSQVEALLAGVPGVCTDIPGARWVIRQTKMGEIVKTQDPLSLAEGIIKVIKQRKRYLNGARKMKELFDYQKTLLEYEKTLGAN